ncbi:MAG: tol-pal system-associated acyl-CoA thioesterase [Rhodobacteraceae bacterium]|nr:tol-pal system-associated acyl-CoA thioesterase [Paracoccaceae bacterium]
MHELSLRVYYEDTDLAGIVYYANYLKFIERGRSELLRALGVDQGRLKAEAGIVFAVRRVEADYLLPAVFDDLLTVRTWITSISGARVTMGQEVVRDGTLLFRAEVTVACLTPTGRPARIPPAIRATLTASG